MDDKKTPLSDQQKQEAAFAQLRADAESRMESAPSSEKTFLAPKSMGTGNFKWVLRGLMVVLVVVVLAEFFVLRKYQQEREFTKFEEVPVEDLALDEPPEPVVPAPPEVSEPERPESLIIADEGGEVEAPPEEEQLGEPPTPTLIPLPEGVEEVPFPTPSE